MPSSDAYAGTAGAMSWERDECGGWISGCMTNGKSTDYCGGSSTQFRRHGRDRVQSVPAAMLISVDKGVGVNGAHGLLVTGPILRKGLPASSTSTRLAEILTLAEAANARAQLAALMAARGSLPDFSTYGALAHCKR